MEDKLNLTIGANVQLQLDAPGEQPRHMVRLIGYVNGGSLIVATPTVQGKVQFVREGQVFSVRMLRGESVMGFSAKVTASYMKPYPHLHLAYPEDIEQIVVRNSARVATKIPARVRNTKQPDNADYYHDVDIIDLSETGARIASTQPLGEVSEMLQLDFRIRVTGALEELSLLSDLKSVAERVEPHEDGERLIHLSGLQFKALNRLQQLFLHAWLMNHVANGVHGATE